MSRAGVSAQRQCCGGNHRPCRRLSWLVGGLLALQTAPASLAVPTGGSGIPQPTRVERFNPDQQVCLPQAIKSGFARQLQPWADQPPAVLDQLRRVQLDMTRATVQRCLSKGLLRPAEASQLDHELGLQVGSGAGAIASPGTDPASPAPATSP